MDVRYYCMWVEFGLILSLSTSVYAALQYSRLYGLDKDVELLPVTLRELALDLAGRALWT